MGESALCRDRQCRVGLAAATIPECSLAEHDATSKDLLPFASIRGSFSGSLHCLLFLMLEIAGKLGHGSTFLEKGGKKALACGPVLWGGDYRRI